MLSKFQPLKLITSFTVSDKNESHMKYSTSMANAEAFHLHLHKKNPNLPFHAISYPGKIAGHLIPSVKTTRLIFLVNSFPI